jgi:hypothetical protein
MLVNLEFDTIVEEPGPRFQERTRPTSDYSLQAFTGVCKCAQSFLTYFCALDDPLGNEFSDPVILAVRPSLTNTFQCNVHIGECSSIKPDRDVAPQSDIS